MKQLTFCLALLLVVLAPAGCAASREAAVGPAVGEWDYEIATPDGNYTGTLTITGTPGELSGSFYSNDDGGTIPLETVVYEAPAFNCAFVHPQFGRLTVQSTLEEGTLDGTISVPGYGEMPFDATKLAAEE